MAAHNQARLLALALTFFAAALQAEPCTLDVVARGVRDAEGRVGFILFDSAEGWPKNYERAVQRGGAQAEVGDVEYRFEDVLPGEYAVIVVHDENANRKLDRNAVGRPKEGWGMSNNPKPKFKPPKFSTAAFRSRCGDQVQIEVRY